MKRWGFKGGPASHGTSLAHRIHGSIGSQGHGKVNGLPFLMSEYLGDS